MRCMECGKKASHLRQRTNCESKPAWSENQRTKQAIKKQRTKMKSKPSPIENHDKKQVIKVREPVGKASHRPQRTN